MLEHRIKYRHLQCFLEVARQGSVSLAADTMAVTQPAVSKRLKELEDILGVQLIERKKSGATLTQFGEVFQRYASASVAALQEGTNSIAQAQQGGKTQLTIGVLPTVATSILPQTVQLFRQTGLSVTLKLVSGPNKLLLGQLRVGELDLVVGRLADPEQMSGLAFEHLYSERVAFVVRRNHPLANAEMVNLEHITRYPILYPPADSIIAASVDRFLLSRGIGTLPDRIETISDAFGREFIRQTDAVWIISRGVVAREIASGGFRELAVDTRETLGQVGLTSRADILPSPALRLFMSSIRDCSKRAATQN